MIWLNLKDYNMAETLRQKWIKEAFDIISSKKHILTEWEQKFISDVGYETDYGKETGQLTNHQFNKLMEIKEKVTKITH